MTRAVKVPDQGLTQSRVEAAMRHLSREFPDHLRDLFLSTVIPNLAEKYEYMIRPETFTPSKAATKKQLSNVEKRATALLDSMMYLQGPAIDALNFREPTLGELESLITRLVETASQSAASPQTSDRKGPRPRSKPRKIAEAVADDFFQLTGKPPGRTNDRVDGKTKLGGGFIDLLTEIFGALDVTASVEHHAKEASVSWRKRKSGSRPSKKKSPERRQGAKRMEE